MPGDRLLRPLDIVARARDLLRADGTGGLSMRRLADRLDVSPAALYAHFPSKQALLAAVGEHELGRFTAGIDAAVAEASDPVDAVYRWARARVEYARAEPQLFAVLDLTPERLDPPVDLVRRLGVDDPAGLAFALWAGVRGVATALPLGVDPASVDAVVARLLPGARS